MNKEELKEKANELFAKNPDLKKAFATTDGNVFISENRAKLHAGKGNVIVFENSLNDEGPQKETLNVKETIALINQAASLEDLVVFETDERKGVKEALEKKTTELTKPV